MPSPPPTAAPVFQPTTLAGLLLHHAQQRPHAIALRFEGADTSYAQLAAQAHSMALGLQALGLQAGDRVAYLGLNHPLQIALLFAAAQMGAVCVPLNYRLAPTEWDSLLADCKPRLLLSDAHWAQAAGALAVRAGMAYARLDGDWPAAGHVAALTDSQPHVPVLLVYTSGTTGQPKGALHTQANLLTNMALAQASIALTAIDTIATVLPLFHVGGLCIQTLPALFASARVILHARFDPAATLACIAQDRPTLTLQVPATMRALIEHPLWPSTDLSSLRAVWAGSSVLPAHLVQAFLARGVPLCNVYGSTETGPFSIALGPEHAALHQGSCGWPAVASGLRVEVRLHAAKEGVGELCIRAPNVAQRYWPAQSAVDDEGYFHTGDLARCAADGSYTVVGRAKDMLISGGENIYPAEIENLLSAHPLVAECAVVGLPDAQWGEMVVACVVPFSRPASDAELTTSLAAFLAERIARYKQPRRWVVLGELPKTALGKVQKDQLTAQLRS
jgi:fatty-acyl-CoA synthase